MTWLTCFIHDLNQTKCTSVEMVDWAENKCHYVTAMSSSRPFPAFFFTPSSSPLTSTQTARIETRVCVWLSKKTNKKNKTKISRYLHHVQTTNTTQVLSQYCFVFFPRLSFPLVNSNRTIPETVKRRHLVSTGTTGREHERKLKPWRRKKWQNLVVAVLTRPRCIHKTTIRTLMLRN